MQNTIYSKDRDGHQLKTTHELANQRVLIITTSKSTLSKRLQSRAAVHLRDGNSLIHAIGYGTGGGDFSERLLDQQIRATEKATRSQHEQALSMLDSILVKVAAHYANQSQAGGQ